MNETQTDPEPSSYHVPTAQERAWLRLPFGDKFRAIRIMEIMPGSNRKEIRDRLRSRRLRKDGKLRGSE